MAMQAAIKQQAEDLREELSSLGSWEDDIKRRDAAIKAKTIIPPELPPIRGTAKPVQAPKLPKVDPVAEAKDQGNEYFKRSQWDDAIRCYTKGIDLDPKSTSTHVLYSNRAMCFIKQQKWALAEADASMCVDLNKSFAKGFFRRAVARKSLGRIAEARRDLEVVLVLSPGDAEADKEMVLVTEMLKKQLQQSAAAQPGSSAPTTKRKIQIQEVDDDDDENSRPAAARTHSASVLTSPERRAKETEDRENAEHEWRSKQHADAARQAQMAAERQRKEQVEREERQRQAVRRTNPRVEIVEDDDEVKPAAPVPSSRQPSSKHVDPSGATQATPKSTSSQATPITLPTSVVRPLDSLKPPKSYSDFEKVYNDIKGSAHTMDHYLGLIPPSSLKAIFGSSLSPEMLLDLLSCSTRMPAERACEFLRGLSQVRRLEELVMFFESHEKDIVQRAVNSCHFSGAEATKMKTLFGC